MTAPNDPFDLDRFIQAQAGDYQRALEELRSGQKRSHWMWYIFPQLAGLGRSAMAERYAIRDLAEAKAYLQHPVLGPRLIEIAQAVLDVKGRSAHQIFGSPDDLKLHSSATLFAQAAAEAQVPEGAVFEQLIDTYFAGQRDTQTLQRLDESSVMGD